MHGRSSLGRYYEAKRKQVDRALRAALPRAGAQPARIHAAMRYALLSGGKRLRPVLCLAACEAVGGQAAWAMHAACALECVHAYSLVHDDLPAMDNADERRGRPSCHKRFGEAVAVLTGDALLTLAFELLSRDRPAAAQVRRIATVARACGTGGLIGGQVMDLAHLRSAPGRAALRRLDGINRRKTAALIVAALEVGGMAGGGAPGQLAALRSYGARIGAAFQLVDDVLDGDGYAMHLSSDQVLRRARRLVAQAKRALAPLAPRHVRLAQLAEYVVDRTQ